MHIHLDFETRSRIDIKARGVDIYASDPSTDIQCLAWMTQSMIEPQVILHPEEQPCDHLREIAARPDSIFVAHNASFERAIWREIMVKRYGFPEIPINRWRCTAARAAYLALPRKLEMVAKAVKCPIQKDMEGNALMLKYCKPQSDGTFLNDLKDLLRIAQYCVQDVLTEVEVFKNLPELPPEEQAIWELSEEINDRGFRVDTEAAKFFLTTVADEGAALKAEAKDISGGIGPQQIQASIEWLASEGVDVENMKAPTIKQAMARIERSPAYRFMEIRTQLGKASVGKFKSLLAGTRDGRFRSSLLYHGATTGRWTGQRIQPHNLPRESYKPSVVDDIIATGVFPDGPIIGASKCIRGTLLCDWAVDFSSIEGRIAAWLAEEETALDVYREGLDPYKVAASYIFNVPYDEVTDDQRQIGKVAELALGYQGWIGAFRAMSASYPKAKAIIESWGGSPLVYSPEEIQEQIDERSAEICKAWRESRPMTKAEWAGLEDAAIKTIETGKNHRYGKILFGIHKDFLVMKLPSGQKLWYPYPSLERKAVTFNKGKANEYTTTKTAICFWGVEKNHWIKLNTYGGKLFENAVQALARHRLVYSMQLLDMLGVPITLHIHDEIAGDSCGGIGVKAIEEVMLINPPWCLDLPIAAKGWEGEPEKSRYRKD